MATPLAIDEMTIEEKLRAMEALWVIFVNMKRPCRSTNDRKRFLTGESA